VSAVDLLPALGWLAPFAALPRLSDHRPNLSDVPPAAGVPVSVIIPARNEAATIATAVRSILASAYHPFELIVVDDRSSDDTAAVVAALAAEDPRLRLVSGSQLLRGWYGKPWACAQGAAAASGVLLLFTDADTRHRPDLLPRTVNAMRGRGAELLSIAGNQEMHSFWERVVQPVVFGTLGMRYGGLEEISTTHNPTHVIANGQFILVRRDVYDAMGGHERVKHAVAEDLMLAQEWVGAGRRLVVMLALDQFSTHMYASLAEIVAGWRKNIFAGGRNAMVGGDVGRALYPFALIGLPLYGLIPAVGFSLALVGALPSAWLLWGGVTVFVALLFWVAIYHFIGDRGAYAVLFPLGLAVLLYIAVGSVLRGERVEWKHRAYRAG